MPKYAFSAIPSIPGRPAFGGVELRMDYAREALGSLQRVWKRPVEIHTVIDNKPSLWRFDGKEHAQRALK